jgi:hypothetical protein
LGSVLASVAVLLAFFSSEPVAAFTEQVCAQVSSHDKPCDLLELTTPGCTIFVEFTFAIYIVSPLMSIQTSRLICNLSLRLCVYDCLQFRVGRKLAATTLQQCLATGGATTAFPGSSAYTNARVEYNERSMYAPAAFVFPTTVAQVQNAISCSQQLGVGIVPRGGGHSYEDYSLGSHLHLRSSHFSFFPKKFKIIKLKFSKIFQVVEMGC